MTARDYGGGFVMRSQAAQMWPGVTEPWCKLCSWTWHQDCMQVKVINRACPAHGRLLA